MSKESRSDIQFKLIRKVRLFWRAIMVASFFVLGVSIGTGWAETYYIDYSAPNDSANGTSKSTPWKRQPYMQGFAGSYTHTPGDVFIFKGGVTWPAECFNMAIPNGGTAGNIDSYTVDKTWYAGGSWTRPVWDGEYATLTNTQSMVSFSYLSYITFNNLEVKRHKSTSNQGQGMFNMYACNYIQWTYMYLHSWSLDAGVGTDDAHGPINHYVSGGLSMTGVVVDHSEIENSAWTGIRQNGLGIREVNTIRFSMLHDMSSLSLFAGDVHDNTVYNIGYPAGNQSFDPLYHDNIFYMDWWNGNASIVGIPAYCYNNILYDVNCGSSPIYLATESDATLYVYNNLVYGVNGLDMAVQVDPAGGTGDIITLYVYNNTFLMPNGVGDAIRSVNRGGNPRTKEIIAKNNHIIGTNVSVLGGSYASSTIDHNLIQTAETASGQGYVLGNLYAPTGAGSTIDSGTNASTILSTDRNGTSRPTGLWDIGAYEWSGSSPTVPTAPSALRLK